MDASQQSTAAEPARSPELVAAIAQAKGQPSTATAPSSTPRDVEGGAEADDTAEPEKQTENTPQPAGDEPAVEAKDPEAEAPAKPERRSRVIDQLARDELKLRRRETALREREAQLEARAQKVASVDELIALGKSDPLAYLERAGVPLDAITQAVLEGRKPKPAQDPVEERIAKLEAELAAERAEKKQAAEAEQQARKRQEVDRALARDREEIGAWVGSVADAHPFLLAQVEGKVEGAAEAIQRVQVAHWKETGGKYLTNAEAAGMLERELNAQYTRLNAAHEKRAGAGQSNGAAPRETQREHKSGTAGATIGKSHTTATAPRGPRPMTDEDRRLRALRRVRGG